jgi:hypothetical protein
VTSTPPPPVPPAGWAPSQPVRRATTNGFAVAALVLGLSAFCTWTIGGILAVVFGNIALSRIDAAQGAEKGRGLAIAGIVLGWIAIAFTVVAVAVWFGYGISNL